MSRKRATKKGLIKRIQNHLNNSATSVDVRLGLCVGIARRAGLLDLAISLEDVMNKVNELSEELE